MSKVNAMQAMREARYAARKPVTAPAVPARAVRVDAAATVVDSRPAGAVKDAVVEDGVVENGVVENGVVEDGAVDGTTREQSGPAETEVAAEALCGHRSMNNRICKRPAGHAEKNHRYH